MTPLEYFTAIWERYDHLDVLYHYAKNNISRAFNIDELLRSELVGRISALDLYIHELVAQNMVRIYLGTREKSRAYNQFSISMDVHLKMQEDKKNGINCSQFEYEVRNRVGLMTFQNPDQIAEGVRLISDIPLWNTIATNIESEENKGLEEKAKFLKRELSFIVQRRNKIVHEGDLHPGSFREPVPINQDDIKKSSDFIRSIVKTIDAIFNEQSMRL